MLYPQLPDSDLLKVILEPLLEDIEYWLGRTQVLLDQETIAFLESEQQTDLRKRVEQTLLEIGVARSLFKATGEQVGIDTSVLMNWHKLVAECWQVMIKFRVGETNPPEKL